MAIDIQPLGGDLGCVVSGIDCNHLTDGQFLQIQDLVARFKVVVLRDQGRLTPENQLALNKRFDPSATEYGHARGSQRRSESILSKDGITIPGVPQVQVLGSGPLDTSLAEWYAGLEGSEMRHPTANLWHRDPLSKEAMTAGKTRFYRWHIDAQLFDGANPPLVTTLLGIKNPKGDNQTIVYDDGTGDQIEAAPGSTAFVSGSAALAALPEDLRQLALHSSVTYAPHPYVYIAGAKCHSTGLVCHSDGLEKPLKDLPAWRESQLYTVPLVWTSPVTGEKSLQIHGACVWKLHLRSSPDRPAKTIDDLAEVRQLVYKFMRPGIAPERVYCHAWQDGDLAIFDNRAVWHSVLGQNFGSRIMHQCNLASPIPVM